LAAFEEVLLEVLPFLSVEEGFLLFVLLLCLQFVDLFSHVFVLGLELSDFLFIL
jgi:hypothetical protein